MSSPGLRPHEAGYLAARTRRTRIAQEGTRGAAAGPTLIGIAALAGVAALWSSARPLLRGPDAYWHLDLGRRIVAEGGLPRQDPLSFLTDGQDWILNQWGTDLLIGLLDRAGGLWLVAVAGAVAVGIGIALAGREMWRRSPSLSTLALLALVLLSSMPNWILRGNLATLILVPLLVGELRRPDPRTWRVALLMVLWANLHAVFLLGVALVLVDSVGRAVVAPSPRAPVLRRGATLTLVAMAAGLLSPYGPRYLAEVGALALRGPSTGISEWAPSSITELQVLPYTILVAAVLVALGTTARREALPEVLLAVAGSLFGVAAQRNIAAASMIVAIVGAPYVHRAWRDMTNRGEPGPPRPSGALDRAAALLLSVLSLLAVAVNVPNTDAVAAHATDIPLPLIQRIDQAGRPVRASTNSLWAPAVSTLTTDRVRTEVDGRAELFDDAQTRRHQELHRGMPGWSETLDDWCVTDALVPTDAPLHGLLADHADWQLVETGGLLRRPDADAAWFTRSGTPAHCR